MPIIIKPLKDFPGYSVSSDGVVYTYWIKLGLGRGLGLDNRIGNKLKALKPNIVNGYKQVTLSRGGKPHYRKVHRLVLETFVGPCPEGMEACHNNSNTLNNTLGNLGWGTKHSNYADRFANGTNNDGERNGRAKLTLDQVREIRIRLANGEKQVPLSREFGVTQVLISRIKLGKVWGALS